MTSDTEEKSTPSYNPNDNYSAQNLKYTQIIVAIIIEVLRTIYLTGYIGSNQTFYDPCL